MSAYKLGENLTLNQAERKLLKGEIEIRLPELSYRLLVCLVEHAPNVVSHDKLLHYVWQGKVVSEDTIKKRVSRLREALTDENEIDTIIAERSLGYRFTLSVKRVEKTTNSLEQELESLEMKKRLPHFCEIKKFVTGSLFLIAIVALWFTLQTSSDHKYLEEQTRVKSSNLVDTNELDISRFIGLQNEERINNSIEELKATIQQGSSKVAIFTVLSELHLTKYQLHGANQYDLIRANEFALQAVETSKNQPWAHVALGNVQIEQGKYKNAIESANIAISIYPKWVNGYVLKSNALNQSGDFVDAWQAIQIAHKLQPDNPLVKNTRTKVLLSKNMFSWSERYLVELIESEPNDAFYLLTQAEYFLLTKEYNQAEIALTELLILRPNFIEAHLLMANALELQGSIEQSLAHLERVANSHSKHAQLALYLSNLIDGKDRKSNRKNSEKDKKTEQFLASLSALSDKKPERFLQLVEQAVQSGFSKDYLLASNIIFNALEQQVNDGEQLKEYQELKVKLFKIKQARRVKRVPIL